MIGIGLAAFFAQNPPSIPIERDDEAYARYIVHQMPPGLAGLALAAVFAAAMSTLSSSLNSSAAAVVSDFGRAPGQAGDPSTDLRQLRYVRLLTVVFGVTQAGLAMLASLISTSVVMDALAVAGFVAGVLLGVFALGTLTRQTGQGAALFGMINGVVVLSIVKFQTDVAWPWYAIIGGATTFIAGWAAGQFTHSSDATPR